MDLGTNFGALNGSMCHTVFENIGEYKKTGKKQEINRRNWRNFVLKTYREDRIWIWDNKATSKHCEDCPHSKTGRCKILDMPVEKFEGCPKHAYDDSIDIITRVLQDKSKANPLERKVIDTEKHFDISVSDGKTSATIQGYIDIVSKVDKDTIEVFDWKTGKYMKKYNELRVDPQLRIYHLAAKTLYPEYTNILTTIGYIRGQYITVPFDNEDDRKTAKAVIKYWKKIRGDNKPKPRALYRGRIEYDWRCKALCCPEICKKIWGELNA